jgi:secreted PhoX family phosphatase
MASPLHPDRRELLAWLGASAGWLALSPSCATHSREKTFAFAAVGGEPSWTPLALPVPIASDGGSAGTDAARLARYAVRDELLLPEGFEYELLATYGESFGPEGHAVPFGYNNDFLGFLPSRTEPDEAFLVVNHESVSPRPWLAALRESLGAAAPRIEVARGANGAVGASLDGHSWIGTQLDPVVGAHSPELIARVRDLSQRALDDMGITVLHMRRDSQDWWRVVRDSTLHKRFSGGAPRHATHSNCSGTVTPWGTALSGEENFQDYVPEFVDSAGEPSSPLMALEFVGVDPRLPEPFEINGFGSWLAAPQDGRDFGWVVHVDPHSGELRKLRRLGRMRHENVALRVEVGKPLVAYTGDDRRGGHVWKFVSARCVERVDDPANVELFEDGTLYVARFSADGGGEWLPLVPEAPLARPTPETTAGGHLWLPSRSALRSERRRGGWVAVSTSDARQRGISADEWCGRVSQFALKPFEQMTLGDLVDVPSSLRDSEGSARHRQDVLLLDAVVMANAIGATPCARPEDMELHPHDGSLFLSFSDFTALSSEGSPDGRVFPHARGGSSRRYGGIYRIEEVGEAASTRFRWSAFCESGELADGGHGFANPDNLCFDPDGNLWVLTDIGSLALNSAVTREGDSAPGQDRFAGVFGSSALFMIPTRGERAGVPHCFAIGPVECELCGVTFSSDGQTLFLSVQHPGEVHGARGRPGSGLPTEVERRVRVATREGVLFEQLRSVPIGSNWPSGILGRAPRPAVVAIRRSPGR